MNFFKNLKVHPVVFYVSSGLILAFVVLGAIFNEAVGSMFAGLQDAIIGYAGWFYVAASAGFLVFVIYLFFSQYGAIRLGQDDEEPAYSYPTWLAMLFSAGMGIGLVFFSVAEPIMHFANPPRAEGLTVEAARDAITVTFFHWGLHAWAIYVVVGLSLAYFSFRHGLPLTLRSALYPLIGRHIHGTAGNLVDILAVFGTVFGLATSLGLGVMQINAGLDYLGLMSVGTVNQVILIALITLAATASVATGLDKGIRRLSELNMVAAAALLFFVFIVGPSVFLMSSFIQSLGRYASELVQMTFRTDAFIGLEWQKSWTMFYWAWWISWSPFVGMFIARVSRGRTLREFVGGVLFIPTLLTFFWMTVFGNTALHMELFGGGGIVQAVTDSLPTALYVMLDKLPLSVITATLATIVIAIFFVTSSDSGSLVVDILTSGGRTDTPVGQRVFWAITEGAVAAILLLTGGLLALQTAAVTTALPFCVVMVFICIGLLKGLRAEVRTADPLTDLLRQVGGALIGRPLKPVTGGVPEAAQAPNDVPLDHRPKDWRRHLGRLIDRSREQPFEDDHPETRQTLATFIDDTVLPAFNELKTELETHGRTAEIIHDDQHAAIRVLKGEEEEFAYAIKANVYRQAHFAYPEQAPRDRQADQFRYAAEAVLRSGSSGEYDLADWSRSGLVNHFLHHYARWMGW
ncbi:MAG: BCCT family transporter [Opitutales bacterium]